MSNSKNQPALFEVDNVKRPSLWSQNRLAIEFDMSRNTIIKRLSGVRPDGKAGGFPAWLLKNAATHILEMVIPDYDEADPDGMSPHQRHQFFASELKRTQLETLQGKLIPADEVRQQLASALKSLSQTLEALPDSVSREVPLPAGAMTSLRTIIDRARAEMYTRLTSDGDDDS